MDESGELGGLETMDTLTELGDELTLGDIDGEWRLGGSAGGRARGGRGYGRRSRVRVRPPRDRPGVRGKGTRGPTGAAPAVPGSALLRA